MYTRKYLGERALLEKLKRFLRDETYVWLDRFFAHKNKPPFSTIIEAFSTVFEI